MKSKENNLEKNVSRLVKLAGDSNEPGKAFADSVVKNALDELKGTKAEREESDKFVGIKWKRTLCWAAVVLVVCGIGFGILISNAGKTGETTGVDFSGGPNELVVKDSGVELVVEETSLPTGFVADEAYESLKVSKNLDAFLKQSEPNYNMLLAAAAKPKDMGKPKPGDSTPVAINIAMSHGPVKDGLAAFLICQQKQFKIGEPIIVIYGIVLLRGTEKQEIMVCPPGPLVDHDFSWLSVKGPGGKDVPYTGFHIDYEISDPKKIMHRLWQRQFVGSYDSVEQIYNLSDPGTYTVKWNYKAIPGYPWWQGHLVSNEIQIEVVK